MFALKSDLAFGGQFGFRFTEPRGNIAAVGVLFGGRPLAHVHARHEFTIESDRKLHCNLDGEPILKKRLEFSVLPQHLLVAY